MGTYLGRSSPRKAVFVGSSPGSLSQAATRKRPGVGWGGGDPAIHLSVV